jgi:hypothetical protein
MSNSTAAVAPFPLSEEDKKPFSSYDQFVTHNHYDAATNLRKQDNIETSFAGDLCVRFFCHYLPSFCDKRCTERWKKPAEVRETLQKRD